MGQQALRGFADGQRAWFANGRSAIVLQGVFNPNALQWQYDLGPLGRFYLESDLFSVNPIVDVPDVEVLPSVVVSVPVADGITLEQVREIVGAAVAGLLVSQNVNVEILEGRLDALEAIDITPLQVAIDSLETSIVTLQLQFENRDTGLEAAADESGDGGRLGFFRRVGGFIRSPFAAILGALEDYIGDEVLDGLTR